ncbi:MAG: class I SAM-dependent methyltransferase [Sedimentisphaerales bacterium]|nr:class I SAM-dependent methyltransferase [Sedimentisphaerales bacterium]
MNILMTNILDLAAGLGLYDLWAKHHLQGIHRMLIELADIGDGGQVLDVGCGTGIFASLLTETSKNIGVFGIDTGRRMIRISQRRARKNGHTISYTVGSATELPYAEGQFDVVFSCMVFHLLDPPEQESALKEICRVLKPGGKYVAAEFEEYPAGFLGRRTLRYPVSLTKKCGFHIDSEIRGPFVTKRRPTTYRVLVKPEIYG